jgi:hypothetical protein
MKKPKLDVISSVLKPYQAIKQDESQMTISGEPMKTEPDYERLERQWVRDSWNERKLFNSHIPESYSSDISMRGENFMAETKAKPEHIRAGVLSLSVWTNKSETGTYKTFGFQRSYMDKDKAWQNTESLRGQDLLPLAELLRKAYDQFVATKEKTE